MKSTPIRIVNVVLLALAGAWFGHDGGWESAIGVIGLLVLNIWREATDRHAADSMPREVDVVLSRQQHRALKLGLALVYRARNTLEAATAPSPGQPLPLDATDRLHAYHAAIEQLLYDERAVIPPQVFDRLHGMKHELARLNRLMRDLQRNSASTSVAITPTNDVVEAARAIDTAYKELVERVQGALGVAPGTSEDGDPHDR